MFVLTKSPVLPHGRGVVHKPNATANQRLTVDVKP